VSARIHRLGRCYGLVLWKRPHVELWFCWEGVAEHRHPEQGVEVIPLFGWARFYRRCYPHGASECVAIGPKSWGRAFTVPAGWPHWFELLRTPLVFLNRTDDGRSAAENIDTNFTN
jgi:hypothetical protein